MHGSAEGLGEGEDPQIQTLCQKSLVWGKLTHLDGKAKSSQLQTIATYEISVTGELPEKDILAAESFFWTSSSIFDLVTKQFPQILGRKHCSGPGNTWKSLNEILIKHGFKAPHVFLNENQWRNK